MKLSQLRKELIAEGVEKRLRYSTEWETYCGLRYKSKCLLRGRNNDIEDFTIRHGSADRNAFDIEIPAEWLEKWERLKSKYGFEFETNKKNENFLMLKI